MDFDEQQFEEQVKKLAEKVSKRTNAIENEEATKLSLILPFIRLLGYNSTDPAEVIPEFTADIGEKKGEKVDFAIKKEGKLIMAFECKPCSLELVKAHRQQLARYFGVMDTKLGIVTNGVVYRFYSDLDKPNRMDEAPFLEIDMRVLKNEDIEELKKFRKESFDRDGLRKRAEELKYAREIKRVIGKELAEPSEDFIRFFVREVYTGNITGRVKAEFSKRIKRAFDQFMQERLMKRLRSMESQSSEEELQDEAAAEESDEKVIETTMDEYLGFHIVQAILNEVIDLQRVAIRDTQSYCGVLLDDNNRKPICRLHFNSPRKKYVGFFDHEKNEEKILINKVNDIYKYSDRLKATIAHYDAKEQ